jgi:hypothetical protein
MVDDKRVFSEMVINRIAKEFPSLKDRIELISTEKVFRDRLQSNDLNFDLVILDVMVHWAEQYEDVVLPDPSLVKGGFFRAGIRCFVELRKRERFAKVPIVIHSAKDRDTVRDELNQALEENGLPREDVRIFEKTGDVKPLLEAIGGYLAIASESPG